MRYTEHWRRGKRNGTRRVRKDKKLVLWERYRRGLLWGPWGYRRAYSGTRLLGRYRAGRRVGLWTSYWGNRKPSRVWTYRNGRRHGVYERRTPGGGVIVRGEYDNDRPTGTWTKWDWSGRMLGTYTLTRGTGTAMGWYRPNRIAYTTQYRNGREHGAHREFTPRGRLRVRGNYRRGKRHGRWREYHSNRKLAFEAYYRRGLRHGRFRRWRRDGHLEIDCRFVRGKRQGRCVDYFPNGVPSLEGSYVADKRDGEWKQLRADRSLAAITHWRAGVPTGTWRYYDRQGKVERTVRK
jgi:antitoxin component YwqK of YwqJK toxin-antitoxin module